MPLVGMTADIGWRYAWLGVPLAAGVAGLAVVGSRPPDQRVGASGRHSPSLRWDAKLVGWTVGELLSYAGWGGALVYAGALLVESYGAAPGTVGVLLGAAAIAAFPGNFLVRRWLSDFARDLLIALGFGAAAITAVFGTVPFRACHQHGNLHLAGALRLHPHGRGQRIRALRRARTEARRNGGKGVHSPARLPPGWSRWWRGARRRRVSGPRSHASGPIRARDHAARRDAPSRTSRRTSHPASITFSAAAAEGLASAADPLHAFSSGGGAQLSTPTTWLLTGRLAPTILNYSRRAAAGTSSLMHNW